MPSLSGVAMCLFGANWRLWNLWVQHGVPWPHCDSPTKIWSGMPHSSWHQRDSVRILLAIRVIFLKVHAHNHFTHPPPYLINSSGSPLPPGSKRPALVGVVQRCQWLCSTRVVSYPPICIALAIYATCPMCLIHWCSQCVSTNMCLILLMMLGVFAGK